MKLIPKFAARAALQFFRNRAGDPDFIIGEPARPYIHRWYLYRNKARGCVYLHKIIRDDDDRALHDHPWFNASIVLAGGYVEVLPDGDGRLIRKWRGPGSVVFRRAASRHRLELPSVELRAGLEIEDPVCWSLFLTGPRVREWGFYCNSGWKHYTDFVNPADGGATIGLGCDAPSSVPGTAKRDAAA